MCHGLYYISLPAGKRARMIPVLIYRESAARLQTGLRNGSRCRSVANNCEGVGVFLSNAEESQRKSET